jgi:hypothetical protein
MGDVLRGPAKAFVAGLMLLAGLILLAACANLDSLFAARAAGRTKEVALRLALESRRGAGDAVVLHWLSTWHSIHDIPTNVPVNPDVRTYATALLLALLCGLLFGMMPVRRAMRTDPWRMIRSGMSSTTGMGWFTLRDVLLVTQFAICAVLVTSSLAAVEGLMRSVLTDSSQRMSPLLTLICRWPDTARRSRLRWSGACWMR